MKKYHSKLSKNESENIQYENLFVKVFKILKIFDKKQQLNW